MIVARVRIADAPLGRTAGKRQQASKIPESSPPTDGVRNGIAAKPIRLSARETGGGSPNGDHNNVLSGLSLFGGASMARFFRLSMLLAAVGIFAATAAVANIPSPELSDVPRYLTITPDASFGYTVTVNGPQGPVNGAGVELRVSIFADPLVCWCAGQAHPSITGVTNVNGQVTFNVAGGGCIMPGALGEVVCDVLADGILLGQVGINSPDAVNGAGFLNTDDDFTFDASCAVSLADAVFHTTPIAGGLAEPCTKFTDLNNPFVVVTDAVTVTPYIVNGVSCTP
jgi:hypothetical protein